jgi:Flp pilus assembly protein TadG
MLHQPSAIRRRAATVVETAIVLPVVVLFLFGILVGAMGIYRFQEVASLAREATRWASVHGSLYAQETGKSAATADDVYKKAILPKAISLDPSKLSYTVTWTPNNQPPKGKVTVTVSYQWFPELFLVGPLNLTSSSTMQMCY